MISLHNIKSAAQTADYFSKDNYYTQDQNTEHSAWFGAGAATLGLKGQVAPGEFMNLLEGQVGGQQLGKWITDPDTGERKQDHLPGIDLTFSAPKSVSLLAEIAGDADVREAHEAAVRKALGYVEEHVVRTRATENGVTRIETTGNLIAGLFKHNTSRDLDPQTHTHAVVMNATLRPDGQWRSIDNREIYATQKLVGAIYTAELASGLQQLGYRLTAPDRDGNFEVQGISREQIEHFSQRREAIKEALANRDLDLESASSADKERAALATRDRKKDVDHDALIGEWKARARQQGLDLPALQAEAAQRREQGIEPPARLTGRDAMSFAAAHLVEREVVLDRNELIVTAVAHGTGRVSAEEVLKAFDKLEKDGDLVALPDNQYTTRKMLDSERWALEFVKAQQGQAPVVLDRADVDRQLAAAEQRQRFPYSEGQREAITLALTSEDRFVAIQGLAGTGKTTMLRTLNEIAVNEGYTVRGMAPTGAASKVMIKGTGIAAETVAMFQIKERQLQKDIEFAKQYAPDFERRPEIWVVDESSFLAQRQMAQLHRLAEHANAKIVYLGDTLQLQGVEAGKPFELAQKDGIATAYMTEINRQETPEMKAAVDLITGRNHLNVGERLTQVELKHNAEAFRYLVQHNKVVETDSVVDETVSRILAVSPDERARTMTITPYNKDRVAINNGVRKGLQEKGELSTKESTHEILVSKGWTRAQIREAQYYGSGDVVRFNRDYRQIEASKGEYARVVGVDHEKGVVTLRKADGRTMEWQPGKHNKVEVYDSEQRQLARGDLIRLTRNDDTFRNGEVARVVALNGNHAQVVVSSEPNTAPHNVNLANSRHWDHAYASTVHGAQGAQQPSVNFAVRMPENDDERRQERALQALTRVFGDRSFYVGVTRASHDITIITNDIATAGRAVTGEQDKTSAVEMLRQQEMTGDTKRELLER